MFSSSKAQRSGQWKVHLLMWTPHTRVHEKPLCFFSEEYYTLFIQIPELGGGTGAGRGYYPHLHILFLMKW